MSRYLQVKSQSAAKMTSSSMVRQTAAPQAMLLKPRRAEASHFARLVVCRPEIKKTGVRTSAPSVKALKARSCQRSSNVIHVQCRNNIPPTKVAKRDQGDGL